MILSGIVMIRPPNPLKGDSKAFDLPDLIDYICNNMQLSALAKTGCFIALQQFNICNF